MTAPETVVVIGGGGFIGTPLVRRLRDAGCHVRIVGRGADPARDRPGLTHVRASVADPAAMRRAIAGADVVYHLAMGGGRDWADYQRDFIDGARVVAELCREYGVRRLIFTSSTAALYLGDPARQDETAGPDPAPDSRSFYTRGKVAAENLLMELHRSANLPVTILRPALVLGRGGAADHPGIGYWATDTDCLGWGAGDNPLPFVLVEDVAEAMFAALDAPGIEGRSYNLAGDVRPSARQYIAALSARSLRHIRFHPRNLARMFALEACKWAVKAAIRKSGNAFPSRRDAASRGLFAELDCTAARRDLNWRPVADENAFYAEAIDIHLRPIPPGDFRLS